MFCFFYVFRKEELLLTSMLIDSYDLTNIWTGLNDLKVRGSYSWSDSSVVRYTNWYNSQPDDSSRRGSCVKASLQRGYRDMMSWADDDCASKNSFICKKLKGEKIVFKLRLLVIKSWCATDAFGTPGRGNT